MSDHAKSRLGYRMGWLREEWRQDEENRKRGIVPPEERAPRKYLPPHVDDDLPPIASAQEPQERQW